MSPRVFMMFEVHSLSWPPERARSEMYLTLASLDLVGVRHNKVKSSHKAIEGNCACLNNEMVEDGGRKVVAVRGKTRTKCARPRAQAQGLASGATKFCPQERPFCSLHTIIQIERLINGHT
ncbi:hypothetical protein HBI92_152300 [Parastagonospora nodorum]|nr:hypothetical protein HBI97_085110 [Parastagonospora nodorum]KAH5878836.1 hypothetical protein HBI92_152300 [Parastagonospora nodorum]KAH5957721.1 hypothetical protein HBI87_080010 [Parastagonospora nodorum]